MPRSILYGCCIFHSLSLLLIFLFKLSEPSITDAAGAHEELAWIAYFRSSAVHRPHSSTSVPRKKPRQRILSAGAHISQCLIRPPPRKPRTPAYPCTPHPGAPQYALCLSSFDSFFFQDAHVTVAGMGRIVKGMCRGTRHVQLPSLSIPAITPSGRNHRCNKYAFLPPQKISEQSMLSHAPPAPALP